MPHCVLLYFCALNASCVGLDDGRGGAICNACSKDGLRTYGGPAALKQWPIFRPAGYNILHCRPAEVPMLSIAKGVFENLDAACGKQTSTAEFVRLQSESCVKFVAEVRSSNEGFMVHASFSHRAQVCVRPVDQNKIGNNS